MVRQTSLTVPPSAPRIPRTSWNEIVLKTAFLFLPTGRFQIVGDGSLMLEGMAVRSAEAKSERRFMFAPGSKRRACRSTRASAPWVQTSSTASVQVNTGPVHGSGSHSFGGGAIGGGSGV